MSFTLQDLFAILGPIGAFGTFMWYHFSKEFEKIDRKFEKIDQKFEKIDQKFEKIDQKIDNLSVELKGEISRAEAKLVAEINRVEAKLVAEINRVEEKLGEKIDAVRDRVSRIEGQLVPSKIIAFEETRPREIMEQKSVATSR
jgi:chromosome segregation ATPase